MIRRVTTPQNSASLAIAGLPPGTPDTTPVQVVQVFPALAQVGTIPADALVTSDGRPVYGTGPGRWGQLAAAGRP